MTIKPKDFQSNNQVNWCPGCGDYLILRQICNALSELNEKKENIVFVSGIGCSSRTPYYLDTYGIHSIHGRAPAIALGLKLSRPELSVWVITGDGDGLSIGTNHLLHVIRRNVDINILLFNNEIYGLTKGQVSPTSRVGTVSSSSPQGSIDKPFNPASLCLSANGTFFARTNDRNPKHLKDVLVEAYKHKGCSFIEIYQNCIVFNDMSSDKIFDIKTKKDHSVYLEDGKPIIFGDNDKSLMIGEDMKPHIKEGKDIGSKNLWTHDKRDKIKATLLASLNEYAQMPIPFGIFYKSAEPSFEQNYYNSLKSNKSLTLSEILDMNKSWQVQ